MMLKKLIPLAGLTLAEQWTIDANDKNLTVSWPGNNDRPAGGIWVVDSPADKIVNGTGSCELTINTAGVQFLHFFNADVGEWSVAENKWTFYAMGNWQDKGQFSFVVNADDEPQDGDIEVSCQNDTPVADNVAVLSSFPQDISNRKFSGSFRIMGRNYDTQAGAHDHEEDDADTPAKPKTTYADSVVLSFPEGMAPVNFTMHDRHLTATQTGASIVISGLGQANFYDTWFEGFYAEDADGNPKVVASYEITATVLSD